MFRWLDSFLDRFTMYKLLEYYLACLLLAALALSATGSLPFGPLALVVCSLTALAACWVINTGFAFVFRAPISNDSSLITGFILSLLITPALDKMTLLFILAASGLAMASKYILAIHRKHIFNPAAIALVLTVIGPKQTASWWVGNAIILPFVLIGGVLIAYKVRRVPMISVFLLVTTAATILLTFLGGGDVLVNLQRLVLRSPIFFLAFVMLTEPATSPTTKGKQVAYGALVGALLPPQVHVLQFYTSPELALIIGNLYTYLVSSRVKLFLTLKTKVKVAANTADFIFYPEKPFAYQPGQYMEFTLPHPHSDSRGDRRYFTLASSPTEPELRLGVKFYQRGSSYKEAMLDMDRRTPFVADHVSGDFILPQDPSRKLAFIAGGIGVTPFRSMTKYLIDTHDQRSVILLYAARTGADIAYAEVFKTAKDRIGMKAIYMLTDEQASLSTPGVYRGTMITPEIVQREIPDYLNRLFYVSGTHTMVADTRHMLRTMGVQRKHIKTDFFPGYA